MAPYDGLSDAPRMREFTAVPTSAPLRTPRAPSSLRLLNDVQFVEGRPVACAKRRLTARCQQPPDKFSSRFAASGQPPSLIIAELKSARRVGLSKGVDVAREPDRRGQNYFRRQAQPRQPTLDPPVKLAAMTAVSSSHP